MIPYGRQTIDDSDIEAVVNTLTSSHLTQGPKVEEFENSVKSYCNAKYAVATSSATAALHAACYALGVKKGDVVWTSAISFVASANCARYCGATVDFVDIDLSTCNMSSLNLREKLIEAKQRGILPKIVIPVHFAGQPCDMKEIYELAQEFNFKIIEDASHALGSSFESYKTGSCKYSDITVFSFHPVKMITSAEGGMALTNNQELNEKVRLFINHGITRDANKMIKENPEPWYYEQKDIGYNYRMSDVHASIGLSQIKKIDEWVSRRNIIHKNYVERLDYKYSFLLDKPERVNSHHLSVAIVEPKNRLNIYNFLKENGVLTQIHYIPIYKHPYYAGDIKPLKHSELYYDSCITLPNFPSLSNLEQERVVELMDSL